jgi:hypothetical protein
LPICRATVDEMAGARAAIAAGALALFAVGAVVASSLSPDGGASAGGRLASDTSTLPNFGDYSNNWYTQAAVASYESRLLRYAQADPSFTGARFAFRSRAFILYGSGAPSVVVRRLLDTPPAHVDVSWVRVPYSRADLDRAVRRLRHAMPRTSTVAYAPNYSGILVGLHPLPATPARQAALYARAQRATDVPVTFLQTGAAKPT